MSAAAGRIGIVCSGLGRVRRGNEAWAQSVAEALSAAGSDIVLFGGGPLQTSCRYEQIRNWPRESFLTRRLFSWHHRYLLEQHTFSGFLKKELRRHEIRLVHAADPGLALRLQRQSAALNVKVIYKDGLLLGPPWCRNFRHVQALGPLYLEQAREAGLDVSGWRVIPHLVNTEMFRPQPQKEALRKKVLKNGVPSNAFIALAAGDLSPGSSKRVDWIVSEFAAMAESESCHLIVAGQCGPEDRARFEASARAQLGGRLHLFTNVSWPEMAELYQCADVFAHAALREPFGIVFLEAMASGLPLLGHQYEVTRWIMGDAGEAIDMSRKGDLTKRLEQYHSNAALREGASRRARDRALHVFSPAQIVPLYEEMHRSVLAAN